MSLFALVAHVLIDSNEQIIEQILIGTTFDKSLCD